jgi:hypothetical protein
LALLVDSLDVGKKFGVVMQQVSWEFSASRLRDKQQFTDLLEGLEAINGFEIGAYDLNRRNQWNPYDRNRAVIELSTQRTQFAMFRGDSSEQVAVISLGKRDEVPRLMLRLDEEHSVERLVDIFGEAVLEIGLERGWISDERWRALCEEADLGSLHRHYIWEDATELHFYNRLESMSRDSGHLLYEEGSFSVLTLREPANDAESEDIKVLGELSDLL